VLRLTAILLLAASSLSAQDCLTRKLLINVTTRDFKRLVGLDKANFAGKFLDKPVEIVNVESFRAAPRVIVLLDSSGSMQDRKDVQLAATLLNATISFLPKGSRVAFNSFSEQVDGSISFDNDPQKVQEKLLATISRPKDKRTLRTALLQTLDTAVRAFGDIRPGDSIVIATDGGDNASRGNPWDMQKTIERAGVRVFVYRIFKAVRATPEEMAGPRLLQELTERTGGDVVTVNETVNPGSQKVTAGLVHLARQMAEHIAYSQELTIRLPESSPKAEKLKLELIKGDPLTKSLQLEFPHYLPPCSATSATATTTQP
jgi:Mg-chelatase subunit ChlD